MGPMNARAALALAMVFTFQRLCAEERFVISTEYFDIIYTEASTESARILAKHADRYEEQISLMLNRVPDKKKRTTVVLYAHTQDAGGSFSSKPSRKIIINDTRVPNLGLGSFKDSLLSIFYHELTHKISLDFFMPLLPPLFTEGVAVAFESNDGTQGRLHDPLTMHYLIQNKLENVSPSWREVAELRYNYPHGMPYVYGGKFTEYLQKIYGKERCARLWQNSWRLFIRHRFWDVFQKDLGTAWNEFIDSIPIPEKVAQPQLLSEREAQGHYGARSAAPTGFAYYDRDRHAVRFRDKAGGVRTLFSHDNTLQHLNFSEDGRYLAVSDTIDTWSERTHRVRVFDTHSGSFSPEVYTGASEACFVGNGQKIVFVRVQGQYSRLTLKDRTDPTFEKVLYEAGPGLPFGALYAPAYAGDGTVAIIGARGMERNLLFIPVDDRPMMQVPREQMPHAMRELQSQKIKGSWTLTFSWANMNMLSRLGFYDVSRHTFRLMDQDVSGGVFAPVVYEALPAAVHEESAAEATIRGEEPVVRVAYTGRHRMHMSQYQRDDRALRERRVSLVPLHPAEAEEQSRPATLMVNGEFIADVHEADRGRRYRAAQWMWPPTFSPRFVPPNSFSSLKDLGHTGLGVNMKFADPFGLVEVNLQSVSHFYPFFTSLGLKSSFYVGKTTYALRAYHEIDTGGFRYTKLGGAFETLTNFPMQDDRNAFFVRTAVGVDSYSCLCANGGGNGNCCGNNGGQQCCACNGQGANGPHYYKSLESPFIQAQVEMGYSFSQRAERTGTNWFVADVTGVSLKLHVANSFDTGKTKDAVLVQTKGSFRLPVVPLRVGVSAYVGYNAGWRGGKGNILAEHPVYGFPGPTYLPKLAGVDGKEGSCNKSKSAGFGAEAVLTILDYDISIYDPYLPVFYRNIVWNVSCEYVLNAPDFSSPKHLCVASTSLVLEFDLADVKVRAGVQYGFQLAETQSATPGFSTIFSMAS